MTAAVLLLAELGAMGVRIRADGMQLRLRPAEAITPELRQRLLAVKVDLLLLLAAQPALEQRLALSEVLAFPAAMLCELPVATRLVIRVPTMEQPVLVATHSASSLRPFTASDWKALIALADADELDHESFARWASGERAEHLRAGAASTARRCTVAYLLGKVGASLEAVVLEGRQP